MPSRRARGLVQEKPAAPGSGLNRPSRFHEGEHRTSTPGRRQTLDWYLVPLPRPLWLETDEAVLGLPFMVMAQVPGQAPSDFPIYNESGFLADAPVGTAAPHGGPASGRWPRWQPSTHPGSRFSTVPIAGRPGSTSIWDTSTRPSRPPTEATATRHRARPGVAPP